MRTKIVLLKATQGGIEFEARIALLPLYMMWECVKIGTANVCVVPAKSVQDGKVYPINVSKIDPETTFLNIGHDTPDERHGRDTLKPTG